MAEYNMTHTGAELDAAVEAVLNGYKDVTPVTALAGDVVWGKVIVTPEGPVTGTYQGIVPPESWRKTAEGDPAVVTDGIAGWPVYSLAAPFTFGQTGEGDPAPTNVRPITAPESVTVTQTGGGQTVEVVASLASDPAVYIGILNLKTGIVTTKAIMLTFDGSDDEGWSRYNNNLAQAPIPAGIALLPTTTTNWNANTHPICVCSHFKPTNSLTISAAANYTVWWSTTSAVIRIKHARNESAISGFKAWLHDQAENGTPVQLIAELTNPATYQLDMSQMPTLAAGENSFSADTGNVSVVYYHVPDDPTNPIIETVSLNASPTLAIGPEDQTMEEPEPEEVE